MSCNGWIKKPNHNKVGNQGGYLYNVVDIKFELHDQNFLSHPVILLSFICKRLYYDRIAEFFLDGYAEDEKMSKNVALESIFTIY